MSARPAGVASVSDVLEIVIPVRLMSDNKTRGRHWSAKNSSTKELQFLLQALAPKRNWPTWQLIEESYTKRDRLGKYRIYDRRRKERRRVTVTRFVSHKRKLLNDADNLNYCVKPLNDALKRLGLVYDDSKTWMEQPLVEEKVSEDGQDRTVIRIERIA